MNKTKMSFCFVWALSVFIANALIPPVASCLDPAQRAALMDSLPRGEAFENNGMNYVWLPTLRGVKTLPARTTSGGGNTAAAAAENQAAVEQKGPFTIYRTPAVSGKSSVAARDSNSTYPIALNIQTGSLAIITGNIWLKLKNLNDAGTIAADYGLTLSFTNADMSTSFYQIPAQADIQALRKRLQADSRISRVTLDMVDRIRHPR